MRRRVILLVWSVLHAAEPAGKIMRPADNSALPGSRVDIVATAPEGRLELDRQPLTAAQPFPNVLHITATVPAGEHKLVLVWKDGQTAIRFFTGPNPPAGFAAFRQHPPQQDVKCTQCHELSQRGRFRQGRDCMLRLPPVGGLRQGTHSHR